MKHKSDKLANNLESAFINAANIVERLEGNRRYDANINTLKENLGLIKEEAYKSTQRLFQLEELVKTSRLLTASLDIRLTLGSVIDTIIYLTGMARAYILLYNESGEQLSPKVARNWNQETLPQEAITFSQTIINEAINAKESIVSQDAQKEFPYPSVRSLGLNTVMCIPLILHDNVIGVIYADSCDRDKVIISPSNTPLIEAFAAQAAIAIDNARLFEQLERSRERIVLSRDDERRRLGREFHRKSQSDLAVMMFKIGTVRNYLSHDYDAVNQELTELETFIQSTMADIRHTAHELYPVDLDELGLYHVLRETALYYEARFRIVLNVPINFPRLSAALECGIYHIILEALGNIDRHAQAQSCDLELNLTRTELRVQITDDGRGLIANSRAGIGLRSMRERAEELGGVCIVESGEPTGTRVTVSLPLPGEPKE